MSNEINKDELAERLSNNLLMFRNKLKLKQAELAEKIGISRKTLLEIENGKRTMKWNVFVALLAVFRTDSSTSDLLDYYEIYTPKLSKYLITPDDDRDEQSIIK